MDVELYCCYSLPLRNYLYENGLRYKLAAINILNEGLRIKTVGTTEIA